MPDKKKKIGKYEIVSILGKGAMGVVYKARDPIIDRYVAIKTQHLNIPDAQSLRLDERFIIEVRAVGRLSHPNIVGVYDFGEDDECSYIVMELVSGVPLTDFVSRRQPITLDQIWDTILKVLDGIQYAHDHNIIHRDIKPANIMRDESGDVKITDFGIALVDTSNLTVAGSFIGTPRYMSPERIQGKKSDHRIDIFSCGVLLHELLTGKSAFHSDNSVSIIFKIINTELPPVSDLCPSCPKGMDAVIAKAVAKDPEYRFLTARDFADAIKKVLDESKSAAVDTDTDTDNDIDSDATVLYQVPVDLPTVLPTTSLEESELTPPGADSELYKGDQSTARRGSRKGLWISLSMILAVVIVVLTFLQFSRDDIISDDLSPVDEPIKPFKEVDSTVDVEPVILPKVKSKPEPEAFSKIKIGAIFSDCPDCPSMIVSPPGNHSLGSTQSKEEQPIHMVKISQPFAVAQFEVSRGEFAKFVSATGYIAKGCWTYENNEWLYREQHNWQSPGYAQDDAHPVVCVSWIDATAYISWLSDSTGKEYRLLSSAEWEYLARTGHEKNEMTNDGLKEICQFANVADLSAQTKYPGWIVHDCEDRYVHTAPVNTAKLKANMLGVSGLLGNAFEWVSDCWSAGYDDVPPDGAAQLTGDCAKRILRGGSWFSQPDYVRFGFQNRFDRSIRASTFGFRVARGLRPDEAIPNRGEPDK